MRKLRKERRLTQTEAAKFVGVHPVLWAQWEAGRKEPGPGTYLQLGKLAGHPDCWFFLERAGLTKSDIYRMLPEIQQLLRGQTQASRFPKIKIVPMERPCGAKLLKEEAIEALTARPLLSDPIAAGEPRLIEESNIEEFLIFPRRMIPHPEMTTCIRVVGNSMSPIFEDGYIVVVDAAQTDRERLKNKIIAARTEEGVTIKWLRRYPAGFFLVPENRRYDPVELPRTPWAIIGRVILWLGHQE